MNRSSVHEMQARATLLERGALGAVALGLLACTSSGPVRIGLVVSAEAVAAAQIAASEINATGGIRGRTLSLRVLAAGGTRAGPALAAAESLVQDPSVIGVVGHSNSSASLSAAQIYNARRVVQIAPTSSSPLLSRSGAYTFRLVASDIHQAAFLAGEVMLGGARPRTAMFFVNDDYGHALHEAVRARLDAGGVRVVYDAPYSEEDSLSDVAAIVRTVANQRPELLVWLGRAVQLRQLLPVLRAAIPGIRILASDGVDNAATERNADGILTGVRYVCLVDPASSRTSLVSLRERFLAATGQPLTAEAALAYDAVMLIATSARAAGTGRDAIRAHLEAIGSKGPAYDGVTGVIAFDENGDPRPSYCLADITANGPRSALRGRPE